MKIENTTNYDKFRTIRGNREINRRHLKKLEESILDNNLLEANPIIVDEKMFVLDGQHRLLAAKKLGIPVYYVVVSVGGISEVQRLNSNVRNWTMLNFLDSYVERGNENYIKLKEFMSRTGLSIGISLLLCTGVVRRGRQQSTVIDEFKRGDFKANFMDFAEDIYSRLQEIAAYSQDESWKDRSFITALVLAYRSGITHEKLLKKLRDSGVKIPRLAARRQYVNLLEDVLSFRSKEQVRIV